MAWDFTTKFGGMWDFGTLAVYRGEAITGIVYLRPGGRPPAEVMADVQALMAAEIDWTPPIIAVYRAGRLRIRKLSEEAWSGYGIIPGVACQLLDEGALPTGPRKRSHMDICK